MVSARWYGSFKHGWHDIRFGHLEDGNYLSVMKNHWTYMAFGLAFLAWIAWLIGMYPELPARIPIHFNAAGEADGWGKRGMIWTLPLIALFTVGLVLSVPYFNQKYVNYPVKITEENQEKQYRLMNLFLNGMAIILFGIMWYISYVSVHMALGQGALPMVYIWLFMGVLFGWMVWYMIRARKLK